MHMMTVAAMSAPAPSSQPRAQAASTSSTRGSFSENVWYYNGRTDETDAIRPEQRTRYTDAELFDPLPPEVREAFLTVQNRSSGDLQNRDFVPQGHGGSHPYLALYV